jgi:hypothetical protein
MDQSTSHITDEVVSAALQLGIQIIRIAKGWTRKCWLLYTYVFAALILKGKGKWQRHFIEHYGWKRMKAVTTDLPPILTRTV